MNLLTSGEDDGVWHWACRALWGVYDTLITRPLKRFYFMGPVWKNEKPENICYSLTKTDASFWTATPENMDKCIETLEKNFKSWDVTVMTSLYFFVLTFVSVKLLFCIFYPRPSTICHCHGEGTNRAVTVDELKQILREMQQRNNNNNGVNQ
jgi:hypothetical protein